MSPATGADPEGEAEGIVPEPPELGQSALARAMIPVGLSGWAIAAGYLGLFAVLLVPAPFALLAGILGVRAIRRDPKKHGMFRAIFGIVMGASCLALWLVWFLGGEPG